MKNSKNITYPDITLHYKVWLSSDSGRSMMGDGKWRLLKTIDKLGSIKSAAEMLHISYRKAWGDLKKIEDFLGFSLVEKNRGGKDGGSTTLTEAGKNLVETYEKFHTDFDNIAQKAFEVFLNRLKND